jgi:threonine synthase
MDVGAPSNFVRILELHAREHNQIVDQISGFHFDDHATREAIREVRETTGYVIDPHGAVGYLAARQWRRGRPNDEMVILETAHPSKFLGVMEEELGAGAVEIPERLACLSAREKIAVRMAAEESPFFDWLAGMAS